MDYGQGCQSCVTNVAQLTSNIKTFYIPSFLCSGIYAVLPHMYEMYIFCVVCTVLKLQARLVCQFHT